MKRQITIIASIAITVGLLLSLAPSELIAGQRRRVVVRPRATVRRPVVRTRLVVRAGHPIRRTLPTNVVVRAARRTVVVNRPLVYLPAVAWTRAVVTRPPRERLVWEDSESIARDEEWVDTNFGIDSDGNALFLEVDGKTKLNFAEVTFANGNVQVVDFNEQTHDPGVYKLLDFTDGRHVSTVRILAKSESDETKLGVYLSK
jgi:hypothetical protein